MPECSQTPRRQRPDYLADFTSDSSADNSCSSSDEEEEERQKAGGGRGGEKRGEKKVSYDLGENKEKNLAERSGRASLTGTVFLVFFLDYFLCAPFHLWSPFLLKVFVYLFVFWVKF